MVPVDRVSVPHKVSLGTAFGTCLWHLSAGEDSVALNARPLDTLIIYDKDIATSARPRTAKWQFGQCKVKSRARLRRLLIMVGSTPTPSNTWVEPLSMPTQSISIYFQHHLTQRRHPILHRSAPTVRTLGGRGQVERVDQWR